jgi:hypothetical protein
MAGAAEGMGNHSRIVLKRFREAHTDSQQTSMGRLCVAERINTLKALLTRKGSIGRHPSFTGCYWNNENESEAKSMDWCHSLHEKPLNSFRLLDSCQRSISRSALRGAS